MSDQRKETRFEQKEGAAHIEEHAELNAKLGEIGTTATSLHDKLLRDGLDCWNDAQVLDALQDLSRCLFVFRRHVPGQYSMSAEPETRLLAHREVVELTLPILQRLAERYDPTGEDLVAELEETVHKLLRDVVDAQGHSTQSMAESARHRNYGNATRLAGRVDALSDVRDMFKQAGFKLEAERVVDLATLEEAAAGVVMQVAVSMEDVPDEPEGMSDQGVD